MKMAERATLAEAEEDIEEDEDSEEGSSEIPTFDVPYFRYIDEDDKEEERIGAWESDWRDGVGQTWCLWPSEEDSSDSDSLSYRYVVVSGTPLKILEHLLSDLRLDDQRGAPENRESGKYTNVNKLCTIGLK